MGTGQDGFAVGKSARLRDRRTKRHIKVDDAATVIAGVQSWASRPPLTDPRDEWVRDIARLMFDQWAESPVVLRVDTEFAGALMNSNTDVELVPDWLARFPFNAIAYSLATPLSLHDGHRMCHYVGMLVVGTISELRAGVTPPNQPGGIRFTDSTGRGFFTRYLKIPEAQGVRCLWVYQEEGDPSPQLQTVTFPLRGDAANAETLADLIDVQIEATGETGNSAGEELPVLIPLSLSLLLYTAATDPEIDWPPAAQIVRPQQIARSRIGDLGWRIGATLRQQRKRPSGEAEGSAGLGGWRLPPHIRKAHWHRVRVVERDENGQKIGSRDGVEGVDWHYEVRWFPPTPVNADRGVAPTVRDP